MKDLQVIGNGLVPVYTTDTGEKVVDGRELWTILESKQDFSTWIKKRFEECDAQENLDFSRLHKKMESENSNLVTKKTEYILKLAIAKEMAMLERNEKGKQVRKYFIATEEKYQQLSVSPISSLEIPMQLQMIEGLVNFAKAQYKTNQEFDTRITSLEQERTVKTEAFICASSKEKTSFYVKNNLYSPTAIRYAFGFSGKMLNQILQE